MLSWGTGISNSGDYKWHSNLTLNKLGAIVGPEEHEDDDPSTPR
jgi:hypothetical protein